MAIVIERQTPVGKVVGRGRKKGSGDNMRLLAKLKKGDSMWDVPKDKMNSIRSSAIRNNIAIKIRWIPDTNPELYAIERLN